jgi:hypothetical protein
MGRATQGVKLIRLDDDDSIADVTVVATAEEEIIEQLGEEPTVQPDGDGE